MTQAFFRNFLLLTSYQARNVRQGHFFHAQVVNFHFFHEWRMLSKKVFVIYQRWPPCTVTLSDGTGCYAQGQISDEKSRVVAASVSARQCKLQISLLLQCLPVSLASYCIVFSSGIATVQQLLEVEADGETTHPTRYPVTLIGMKYHLIVHWKLFKG